MYVLTHVSLTTHLCCGNYNDRECVSLMNLWLLAGEKGSPDMEGFMAPYASRMGLLP